MQSFSELVESSFPELVGTPLSESTGTTTSETVSSSINLIQNINLTIYGNVIKKTLGKKFIIVSILNSIFLKNKN